MGTAYTEAQTKELIDRYYNGDEVDTLAVAFNKTRKSIIAKLSKEGVYVKKGYVTKQGNKPEMKAQMVKDIEEALQCRLYQLDKLPKPTLNRLRDEVVKLSDNYSSTIDEVLNLRENVDILKSMTKTAKKREEMYFCAEKD